MNKKGQIVTWSIIALLILSYTNTNTQTTANPTNNENTWTQKTPLPHARGYLGVVASDNEIYAIGGRDTLVSDSIIISGTLVGYNEAYNPKTDKWTTKTPMPTPREDFAIAYYQNKIYCTGGIWSSISGKGALLTDTNEVYDIQTNTWSTKKPLPQALNGQQANVVEGQIYVIGGEDQKGKHLNDTFVYDPASDTWTTKAPMPFATSGYISTVHNNKIYIIGGVLAGCRIQIYDPQTDTWSTGSDLPPGDGVGTGSGVTSGIKVPVQIYALSDDGSNKIFDPISNNWTNGDSIPTIRRAFGSAVLDDMLYVVGGIVHTSRRVFIDR